MLESNRCVIVQCQKVKFSLRPLTKVLFVTSLILCLCLGNLHSGSWRLGIGEKTIASPITQTVQQGIDRYNSGNFQAAIDLWQQALKADEQQISGSNEQITIRKYLARVYQLVGQVDSAIAQIDRIIAYYRQVGLHVQVGRMLTEQAQAYSSLGLHKRAIALLCSKGKAGGAGEHFSWGAGELGRKPNPKSKIQNLKSKIPLVPLATTLDCDKDSALQIARQESDNLGLAAALGSLGNAYRLQGEYSLATGYLEASLELAQKIPLPSHILAALNSLGNIYTSLANRDLRYASFAQIEGDERSLQRFKHNASSYDNKAVAYFEAMGNLANEQKDKTAQLRSLLNKVVLLHRNPNPDSQSLVSKTIEQALIILENIPDSQEKVYDAIKIASFLPVRTLAPTTFNSDSAADCPKSESPLAVQLLNKAAAIAQHIQDRRSESFALGRLAHVYECRGDYKQALSLTRQAQVVAVTKDSLYQWDWQAGRILKAQGRKLEAIEAYESSVEALKSIRSDITLANRDLQLDFRDTVEPVYRQLAQLWLDLSSTQTNSKTDYPLEYLQPALAAIDQLRLAELQNYLGDECELPIIEKPIALIDQSTAVFNTIILKQGIAIALTLPAGENKFKSQIHWISTDSTQAIKLINDFRLKLEKRSDRSNTYKQRAKQLYDWLIRPYESDLAAAKIKTLVFIQDGILRSIPMAALYDGKQFLIQKYAIAYTPSLALTNPTPIASDAFRVLAFGLTKSSAVDNQTFFPPLQNVTAEIESIEATIPGSKGYLDQSFTRDRLLQELEKNAYPLLHLATHGKFGIDSRETFLVTGNLVNNNQKPATHNNSHNNYNETLTMNELYQLVKSTNGANQIKLLTLSACETAAGSDRDALGIAGIALQAGVQSAVASLWQVDDEATTQLIAKFYQSLREGLSKAEALQTTQKAWLEAHSQGRYNHPGYWSPFILTGNWL